MNFSDSNSKKGFTLMELLVSLAIFMTASLIITEIFVLTQRSQRRGVATQKVQSDARVIFSTLSENIRTANIDYAFYGGTVTNPVIDVLALTDPDGKSVRFRIDTSTCATPEAAPCLQISREAGPWNSLSSRDVKIENLKFFISPVTDPFAASGTPPNVQPSVTIAMRLRGISPVLENQTPISLQTTVSLRAYKR